MVTHTVLVSGMSCEHCVRAVTDELAALPGVDAVDVDLASGSVTISATELPAAEAIDTAVRDAGYDVVR